MTVDAKILGVAILYKKKMYMLPSPNRHHNVIRMIGGIKGPHTEGFYDEDGKFLPRSEAFIRAKKNGQLNRRPGDQYYQGDNLYSEDLW